MKRIFFVVTVLFFCCCVFAKDINIGINQFLQSSGGKSFLSLGSSIVDYSLLSDGLLNLRYDFEVESTEDDADALIDCEIVFPHEIDVSAISVHGIQSFELQKVQVPAILEKNSAVEFFVPVQKNGNGSVEIQIKIPKHLVGKSIPVNVNFNAYKKKGNAVFLLSLLSALGG